MKHALIAAMLTMTTTAAVADYTITTGKKSGTYFRVGHNLSQIVPGGNVIPSKGSVENLGRVADGEAQLGLTQLDAYAWFNNKYPAKGQNVEVLGPLYKECVYMAVHTDGKIKDEDDIQKGVTIAVGRHGSGPSVTWEYMRELNKPYKGAAVTYTGGSRALGKLASSPDSGIDGVLWVTKPTIGTNKMLQTVLKNPNLKLISLDDYSLNNVYKPLGKPIYTFHSVDVEKGFLNDTEISTICVDAAIMANVETDEDLLEDVADRVLNYTSSLTK